MQNFSDRLATAIEKSGRSKGSLAAALGVALSSISRWLAGTIPRSETISQMACVLGVNAQWLLNGEGEMGIQQQPVREVDDDQAAGVEIDRQLREGAEGAVSRMRENEIAELIADWADQYLKTDRQYKRIAIASNLLIFSAELVRKSGQDR